MKIALLTDAWEPQVNGVVRTWQHVIQESRELGHEFEVIHPGLFRTFAAPRYPEIKLAVLPGGLIKRRLEAFSPDAIHLATEGPIGQAGRKYAQRRGLPYTTSYHTQFPHYLRAYFGVPTALTYRFVRWFHGSAEATLAPTQTVVDELQAHGLANARVWSRGVDTTLFHPNAEPLLTHLPKPIFLYAGRVATEKNIEAFLKLDLPGSKVIVGDGPLRSRLTRQYPTVYWAGYQFGAALAGHYSSADVFVFPSRTDTFGVVMLEANASGIPVAAFPVTGPIDVVREGKTGALDPDLRAACVRALKIDPAGCRAYALQNSWRRCAEIALATFARINVADRGSQNIPMAISQV